MLPPLRFRLSAGARLRSVVQWGDGLSPTAGSVVGAVGHREVLTVSRFGPPLDLRPLFGSERAERRRLLSSLSADEWAAPTVPGWTVQDMVAHLVHDHLRRLSMGRDAVRWGLPPGATLAERLDRANNEFVVTARQFSPRVLMDLLDLLGPQLDDHFAALDPADTSGIDVSWAGTETPAWLDIAREFTELWVHQQQIRDAVGRPGADAPELIGPVLDTFARALPYTLQSTPRPEGTSVVLAVTGQVNRCWRVVRRVGAWEFDDADLPPHPDIDAAHAPGGRAGAMAPGAADATTVTLPADTFWRLATRGVTPEQAGAGAEGTGDAELIRAVTGLLAIVG